MNDKMNIAVITIDSLRYDVTQMANTPNFDKLIFDWGKDRWHKVGAHGTYTLPSHIALFHNGYLPNWDRPNTPDSYRERLFRVQWSEARHVDVAYPTDVKYPNIVKGCGAQGYRTVGVGGVDWFDIRLATGQIWFNYFTEFYWTELFNQENPQGLDEQIKFCSQILKGGVLPLFFFMNIATTHAPYQGRPWVIESQVAAFEYVDQHIMKLIDLLPRPLCLVILSDHGECFGEDGVHGHARYHPKVMEVPLVVLRLK